MQETQVYRKVKVNCGFIQIIFMGHQLATRIPLMLISARVRTIISSPSLFLCLERERKLKKITVLKGTCYTPVPATSYCYIT